MLNPTQFRDLVSGRRRGIAPALGRAGLRVLECPYTLAVTWRNRRYDRRRAPIHRVDVPVVSVGNITLGGTGKTPAVEWLARWFADQGVRVALVSRGYGAEPGYPNDEALELAEKLPGVPHILDADRVRGANVAVERHDCQLVLLDDAFQHRRIARDLDIVLVDASEPFGFGHVFPRGTLREPVAGLSRADVVIITRAELVDDAERQRIREEVGRHAPAATVAEAAYEPQQLVSPTGARGELSQLAERPVAAFCGIGNPAGFRRALADCRFRVTAMREFDDHFAYAPDDVHELAAWAQQTGAEAVVCTCKDLVKIGDAWPGSSRPLWALAGKLRISHGQARLERVLRPLATRAANKLAR